MHVRDKSNQEIVTETSGYSVDKGDKALYKSKTGARKYGYIEFFQLSIGDDPEEPGDGRHV